MNEHPRQFYKSFVDGGPLATEVSAARGSYVISHTSVVPGVRDLPVGCDDAVMVVFVPHFTEDQKRALRDAHLPVSVPAMPLLNNGSPLIVSTTRASTRNGVGTSEVAALLAWAHANELEMEHIVRSDTLGEIMREANMAQRGISHTKDEGLATYALSCVALRFGGSPVDYARICKMCGVAKPGDGVSEAWDKMMDMAASSEPFELCAQAGIPGSVDAELTLFANNMSRSFCSDRTFDAPLGAREADREVASDVYRTALAGTVERFTRLYVEAGAVASPSLATSRYAPAGSSRMNALALLQASLGRAVPPNQMNHAAAEALDEALRKAGRPDLFPETADVDFEGIDRATMVSSLVYEARELTEQLDVFYGAGTAAKSSLASSLPAEVKGVYDTPGGGLRGLTLLKGWDAPDTGLAACIANGDRTGKGWLIAASEFSESIGLARAGKIGAREITQAQTQDQSNGIRR